MSWYRFGRTLCDLLARCFFRFRVVHPERIPNEGGVILAMNHASFFDPPLAGISTPRDVYFLARKTLLEWPILGPIFPKLHVVPVDQERADMSALKTVIRLVREKKAVLVFPEGARTLTGELQEAQAGIGLVIAKTMAPVVPMRVFGAYEAYPRGSKFPRLHPITVVVGEPLHFTPEDLAGSGRDLYQNLSNHVMERIAAIQKATL